MKNIEIIFADGKDFDITTGKDAEGKHFDKE